MPSHLLLWPIVILIVAALLIPRLAPLKGGAGRALAFLLASVLAFIPILLISVQASRGLEMWRLSTWAGLGGTGGLMLEADPLAVAALLLIGLMGMGILVATLDDRSDSPTEEYLGGSLVILAGLMAIALSKNLITLVVGSLLLDAGTFLGFGMAGRARWLIVTILQSLLAMLLLTAAALLAWSDGGQTDFVTLSGSAATLAVLALVIRLAPLPFSLYPIAFESLPRQLRALLPTLTLVAGGLLAGRLAPLALEPPLPLLARIEPFAAMGVALAGWVAWRRPARAPRIAMLSAVQAAWALWAFCAGAPELAVTVAWTGATALAVLALSEEKLTFRTPAQIPSLVATLVLIGMPGSALWRALTTLGGIGWQRGDWWLLTLGLIGVMSSVAALIELLMHGEEQPPTRSTLVGMSLLAALSVPLLGVLWGVRPPLVGQLLRIEAALVTQLALPIIGWAGGWWLWRSRSTMPRAATLLDTVADALSFAWLWRLLGRLGWLLLRSFQFVIRVLEGENYGWLLFFLLVAMFYFLQGG